MNSKWRGFAAGLMAYATFNLILRDAIGSAAYLKVTASMEASLWITVPLIVFGMVAVFMIMTPDPKKGGGN